ncbi:MAG: DUF58 domain-containing protein [Cellvibrionaceae bacterium]
MNVTDRLDMQPEGAYVGLQDLQKLRYLAEPMASSKTMARASTGSGQHRSRALSRGMEFEEVRLYQPGDDVRNIDWRVTARTQVTHTKCYRDEKEKPVITLVDQRRSLFFGSQFCFKSVYACHLAALINWSTIKRGDRSGGLVLGTHGIHETRPGRSHQSVNRWLQLLAQSNSDININQQHNEPTFADALKQLIRVSNTGTECILISDFYDLDHDCEKLLFQLSRHNHVVLYWVTDNLEKTLPLLPSITVSNNQEKQTIPIDKNQQNLHHKSFLKKRHYLKNIAQKISIPLIEVNTTDTLNTLLKNGLVKK